MILHTGGPHEALALTVTATGVSLWFGGQITFGVASTEVINGAVQFAASLKLSNWASKWKLLTCISTLRRTVEFAKALRSTEKCVMRICWAAPGFVMKIV